MQRRRFLTLTAASGAAALMLPGWLARGFAQDRPANPPTTNLAVLAAAHRDAQRLGKPLLVLIVPANSRAAALRAHALGELLNHGSDAVMLDLALAHVVCATSAAVQALAPQTPPGEPWMVLIHTNAVPAPVRAIDVPLTQAQLEEYVTEAAIDVRIDALSAAIHSALAGSVGTLATWLQTARAHLDATTLAKVDAALLGRANLDGATADRAAALVRGSRYPAVRAALLVGVKARLRTGQVPGSVWATSSGCGMNIEGGEQSMMDCGMGMTSHRSARFLYFYTRL